MFNVKFNGFGTPNTYLNICNYDLHFYKEEDIVVANESQDNVTLVDNLESFAFDVFKYKDDLTKMIKSDRVKRRFIHKRQQYKAQILELEKEKEKYVNNPKILKQIDNSIKHLKIVAKDTSTKAQIARYEYNTSKVMRTYRIAINHIELDSLHHPNDTPAQRRENIISFYRDCLVKLQEVLASQNKMGLAPKIIKADIHFDQTSPHMHVHISNLYERESTTLKRDDVMTCNLMNTDLIQWLQQINRKYKLSLKPNEIYAHLLQADNPKVYANINSINLVKLMPEMYDVNAYKRLMNLSSSGKRYDLNGSNNWRANKDVAFQMHQANLKQLKLSIDPLNKVLNARKINDASLWFFKQNMFSKMYSPQNKQASEQVFKKSLDNHLENNPLDLDNKLKIDINNVQLNYANLCVNLPQFDPNLTQIHEEINEGLLLFMKNDFTEAQTQWQQNWQQNNFDNHGFMTQTLDTQFQINREKYQQELIQKVASFQDPIINRKEMNQDPHYQDLVNQAVANVKQVFNNPIAKTWSSQSMNNQTYEQEWNSDWMYDLSKSQKQNFNQSHLNTLEQTQALSHQIQLTNLTPKQYQDYVLHHKLPHNFTTQTQTNLNSQIKTNNPSLVQSLDQQHLDVQSLANEFNEALNLDQTEMLNQTQTMDMNEGYQSSATTQTTAKQFNATLIEDEENVSEWTRNSNQASVIDQNDTYQDQEQAKQSYKQKR